MLWDEPIWKLVSYKPGSAMVVQVPCLTKGRHHIIKKYLYYGELPG
jgi:hypothetical protein